MILVNGGTRLCNPVYIDNLIDATLEATKHDPSVGNVYVMSDGKPFTWKEFFGYHARMAGKPEIRSVPGCLAKMIAIPSPLSHGENEI